MKYMLGAVAVLCGLLLWTGSVSAHHALQAQFDTEKSMTLKGNLAEPLSTALRLSMPDARLLAFLWRGMSNEDIARTLNVRLGTVKSRLFRLYQKLGVKKRSMAVLRAAEVLKAAPLPEGAAQSDESTPQA